MASHQGILAEAERWLARLHAPDCTAEDWQAFRRWREVPEHASAYAAAERLWGDAAAVAAHPRMAKLAMQVLAETEPGRTDWRLRGLAVAASAVAVTVALGFFLYLRDSTQTYVSAPYESRAVRLSDGSVVILNVDSRLTADISGSTRALSLEKGEAVFEVSHDKTRPFVVIAGDGRVTALGTRFQARREGSAVTLTLLDGRVSVDRDNGEHLHVTPGQQVRFQESVAGLTLSAVDPELIDSWTHGRLVFHRAPLHQVVAEVNRYARIKLNIADPRLEDVLIGGTFRTGDSQAVADALQSMLSVSVSMHSGQIDLALHAKARQ